MPDNPLLRPPYDGYVGDPERPPCGYRWRAPRGDCITSMDVEHVCVGWYGHLHPHWCPCRASASISTGESDRAWEPDPPFDSDDDEEESWHDQWVQDDQANDDDWMFDPNWRSSDG